MLKRRARFLFVLGLFLLFISPAEGYDNTITHPLLSEAATDLYNKQAVNKLSSEEIDFIKEGSVAEDTDPRYLNHYYDPSTGKGLDDWDIIYGVYGHFSGLPAPEWAENQTGDIGLSGDYSEGAILKNYEEGNKKRAFQGIGHIIHLIQDMAVPAHTRNDSHAMGDPYEKWVKDTGVINPSKASLASVNNLREAFDGLANYSHNNFLSKDTINVSSFDNYKTEDELVDGKNRRYILKKINSTEYKFVYSKMPDSLRPTFEVEGDFKLSLDYWNLLHPQAIGYSAGTIDYFIKKFAEIDKNRNQANSSLWGKAKIFLANVSGNLKYSLGDAFIARRLALGQTAVQFYDAGQNVQFFVDANQEILTQIANQAKNATDAAKAVLGAKKVNPALAVAQPGNTSEAIINQTPSANIKIIKTPLANNQTSQHQPLSAPKMEIIPKPIARSTGANGLNYILINGGNFIPQDSNDPAPLPDILPPDTALTGSVGLIASSSMADFSLSSSELDSKFQCNLNNLSWNDCESEVKLTGLADGDNNFKARAIDSAGNVDPLPAEFSWTIDTASPAIEIASGPESLASSTVANFIFNSEESSANYNCNLDGGEWQACSASSTFENLAEGEHSLKAYSIDIAGNISSTTPDYNWLIDITVPTSTISALQPEYEATGFTVSWGGNDLASGIRDFDVEYKIDNGAWQSWIVNSISTSSIFNLNVPDNQNIYFHARSFDKAGNMSAWTSEAATKINSHLANHLVISEIKTVGVTASDEFIELYNPTASSMDLSVYSIQHRGSDSVSFQKKNFSAGAVIPAKGYFLITSDSYTGSAIADMSQATFNLSNTGGTIFLVNNQILLTDSTATGSTVVDRLAYGAGSYLFPEGNIYPATPVAGNSLERKALPSSTEADMSSGGAHQWRGNGYDTDNNNNDFILRMISDPQDSSSPVEASDGEIPLVPPAVNNLAPQCDLASTTSTLLSWDAPTNANLGDGAHYDLRYTKKNGSCNLNLVWQTASSVPAALLPTPGQADETQSAEISGLEAGAEYCFGIRTFNGEFWSDLSNQAAIQVSCGQPHPTFTGDLIITRTIANKTTSPSTPDENIVSFDFFNSADRGFRIYVPVAGSCGMYYYIGYSSVTPASRLIVEAEYDNNTKLYTGHYRSCTDNWGNVNQIENNRCKDGNFWGSSRWMGNYTLVNASKISILNSSQYTEWIKP